MHVIGDAGADAEHDDSTPRDRVPRDPALRRPTGDGVVDANRAGTAASVVGGGPVVVTGALVVTGAVVVGAELVLAGCSSSGRRAMKRARRKPSTAAAIATLRNSGLTGRSAYPARVR